ncbi:NADP-dependent dehydrogenase-like protein [Pyrenochaeta sp. MPI-SDFR-AT-0127]|nr:NADP-dependent dehydrogenase-like protein [Pyrenochaeta sp. MPI-SDFR-AT-0127]
MPVYFVTGSARGIGLELVLQLAAHPENVIIAAVRRTSSELFDIQRERSNVRTVHCDVSSEASVASLSTAIPNTLGPSARIDVVVNNAAVIAGKETHGLSVTTETLNDNIKTNVLGPALVVAALEPFLAPNALIVNVTSGIGSLTLVSNGTIPAHITGYSISKCALNMLTVHQALALKGKARVVCLDPGHVKTSMGGENAVVEVADSAKGIRTVMEKLKHDDEGVVDRENGRARYLNFMGDEVPW